MKRNTHTYKGKSYRILSRNVRVSYTNTSELEFVRTADEFDSKFKELL